MKNLIPLFIAAVIVACSGPAENVQLKVLHEKRDSLKEEQKKLAFQVTEVELAIAKFDTTKKLTKVTRYQVSPSHFAHYFELYGNVESDESINILPETQGEIKSIKVQEGQKVNKGDVLMTINTEILQKNRAQLKTNLELATEIYNRQKRLWDKKIGSEVNFLQVKANKESLENQIDALDSQIKLATVTAPFAGTVDEIFPKIGEMATPGMPLARLVNLNKVYIKTDVSENYLAHVKTGTDVHVSFPSLKKEIDTKIAFTGKYINPSNRTFVARIDIQNGESNIMPNLLAKLKVKDFENDSAIVIPSNLIQQSASGEDFTYVLESKGSTNVVRKQVLKTGMSYMGKTMITEGLNGDESLISKGARSVKDGQFVEIAE